MQLTYVSFDKQKTTHHTLLEELILPYAAELDAHANRSTPTEFLRKWVQSIIRIHGDPDRHLAFCYDGDVLIGFLYGKVDHPDHKGFVKVGWGYVMEFYVLPEHRRKGYGTAMYAHLENLFAKDGVKTLYLTSDPVTGRPFWMSQGFVPAGERSPENHMEIYVKNI